MSRFLFAIAFLLGAAAVLWMGQVFIDNSVLGLSVTVVIGLFFALGVTELLQFLRATNSLNKALESAPSNPSQLSQWLNQLDASLQNGVRCRIEGERVGLPAPVLTPYLIGLLVMLGLLGTFAGMIYTLKGSAEVLQAATDLALIKAGLAAPIQGLGLAFGTSVAGVSASAMLGLMSTLARRDRMLATRSLDQNIAANMQHFSLSHSRNETFKALQLQTEAFPQLVEQLQNVAQKMSSLGDGLGQELAANQEKSQQMVKDTMMGLVDSVATAMQENITQTSQLVSETMKPLVEELLGEVGRSTQQNQQHLQQAVDTHLTAVKSELSANVTSLTESWQAGVQSHEQANMQLVEKMQIALEAFDQRFEKASSEVVSAVHQQASELIERQGQREEQQLDQWLGALTSQQEQTVNQLKALSEAQQSALSTVAEQQKEAVSGISENLSTVSDQLLTQFKQVAEQTVTQQQAITNTLTESASSINEQTQASAQSILEQLSAAVSSYETMMSERAQQENGWLEQQKSTLESLTQTIETQLNTLREEESLRGEAAVDRLANLESTVTEHLSTLGAALETPMQRLIETASETPKAAAEVISKLNNEITNNVERDNALMEERKLLMTQLRDLSESLQLSTEAQNDAVRQFADTSSDILKEMSTQFSTQLEAELSKLTDVAEGVACSAVDMSSLGDSFGAAVELFNGANQHLMDNLKQIETALENVRVRSDEQLGYYVAQARELIDLSMLSQKEIIDELRQLSQRQESEQEQEQLELQEVE